MFITYNSPANTHEHKHTNSIDGHKLDRVATSQRSPAHHWVTTVGAVNRVADLSGPRVVVFHERHRPGRVQAHHPGGLPSSVLQPTQLARAQGFLNPNPWIVRTFGSGRAACGKDDEKRRAPSHPSAAELLMTAVSALIFWRPL